VEDHQRQQTDADHRECGEDYGDPTLRVLAEDRDRGLGITPRHGPESREAGPHVLFTNTGKAGRCDRFLTWRRRLVETRAEVPPPRALPGGRAKG
jgi:hypothetical protein